MKNSSKSDTQPGAAGELSLGCPGSQTPHGKHRPSQNARKHGILAGVLLHDGDFSKLLVGLQKDFRPTGTIENVLVEKLAVLYLRLSRVYQADRAVALVPFTELQAGVVGEIAIVQKTPTLEVVMRYEANLERNIDRTLNQLERLQRMRLGQPVPPPVKVELST